MKVVELVLENLLSEREDSISGRHFGEGYAEKNNVLNELERGTHFKIIIGPKIKFINDSFWKGFFNQVFEKYKTKEDVLTKFNFVGNDDFLNDIEKNLNVLHAIYNH